MSFFLILVQFLQMCTPFFVVKSILGSYGIISSNNNNFIICYYYYSSNTLSLTLSLLGYLKTRICSSKSHVWSPNMTNDTSLESSCALLLESAKKMQKLNFYRKIQLYSKNVIINYRFLKSPWPCHFKYAKN